MATQVLFIVNRKAGTDDKKAFPGAVARYLDATRFSSRIVYTDYRGHAVELAADAARQGVEIVAAVGGDGSVNEVARGLAGTATVMAIIPQGSGNGLARFLGIPRSTARALELIRDGAPRAIDVGSAAGHLFLSNAGVGFDALIARLFRDNKGRGLWNYARLVLAAIRRYEPVNYKVSTGEGSWEGKAFFVTAANSDQFGYGFRIAPQARIDDGFLDVCVMKPVRWWQLGAVSWRALRGTLPGSRYADYLRCRSLTLSGKTAVGPLQVDGDEVETPGGKLIFEIRPHALRVMVPCVGRRGTQK